MRIPQKAWVVLGSILMITIFANYFIIKDVPLMILQGTFLILCDREISQES
ncbi:hypothetical protein ES702_04929 [subsurface metagenome]